MATVWGALDPVFGRRAGWGGRLAGLLESGQVDGFGHGHRLHVRVVEPTARRGSSLSRLYRPPRGLNPVRPIPSRSHWLRCRATCRPTPWLLRRSCESQSTLADRPKPAPTPVYPWGRLEVRPHRGSWRGPLTRMPASMGRLLALVGQRRTINGFQSVSQPGDLLGEDFEDTMS